MNKIPQTKFNQYLIHNLGNEFELINETLIETNEFTISLENDSLIIYYNECAVPFEFELTENYSEELFADLIKWSCNKSKNYFQTELLLTNL